MLEPFHAPALYFARRLPKISAVALLAGQEQGRWAVLVDSKLQTFFAPCSRPDLRAETLRPVSSSSLPPLLVSGRCTALFLPAASGRDSA